MFAELDRPGEVLDNAAKVKDEPLAHRTKNEADPNTRVQNHKGMKRLSNVDESTED